jgi:predicted site-specific integrase-resolvase
MPVTIGDQTYYRTAEVYRILGVTRNTLYRWLRKESIGEVKHRDSRGWRLFTQDELDKLNRSINCVVKMEHFK